MVLAGTAGHFATTFVLQIEPSRRVGSARACPRVLNLTYPPRTRASLSVCQTINKSAAQSELRARPFIERVRPCREPIGEIGDRRHETRPPAPVRGTGRRGRRVPAAPAAASAASVAASQADPAVDRPAPIRHASASNSVAKQPTPAKRPRSTRRAAGRQKPWLLLALLPVAGCGHGDSTRVADEQSV